jgi:predicted PurR-regulated permease PerM
MNLWNPWTDRAAKALTVVLYMLIITAFIFFALMFKDLLKIFVFGLLINYLLSTPVKFLTKFLKVKAISIFLCFSVIIVFFVTIVNLLSPIFNEQYANLSTSIPQFSVQIRSLLSSAQVTGDIRNVLEMILATLENHSYSFTDVMATLGNNFSYEDFYQFFSMSITQSINIITNCVLTLIISFYLLLDGEQLWQSFAGLFPEHYLKHLTEIKKRIDSNLYSLVIGQFKIATMTAAIMLCTYFFIASEFAILLGSLQMLEFIPILGTWIAIIPSILIILATSGSAKAIIAASVYLIYTQIIRDQIIAPRIMGSAFGIHPLVVVFGLLIGIQVFGLIGIVVSLPIIAVSSAIVDYLIKFKDTSNL